MLAWSIVSLLTYMANDFGSMLACRFILGITEAPVRLRRYHEIRKQELTNWQFYPGALYMISMFYTKKVRWKGFYLGISSKAKIST